MDYLLDRETLERFADDIIRQHPSSSSKAPEEIQSLREELITELDQKISNSIFDKLDDVHLQKFDAMLDKKETSKRDFKRFFKSAGINLNRVMFDAVIQVGKDYLARWQ